MSDPILRVLVLDESEDDADVMVASLARAGLRVYPLRVDSETDFAEALSGFAPHLILSDHGLSGFSALEALAMAKERRPTTPFLLVSGFEVPHELVVGLRSGADGVVPKSRPEKLRPAVDEALELREKLRTLSERQVEVLRLIVRGHTTPQIAELLGISFKTVQTHRSALMDRLDIHDVSGLVRYAVKVRLVPPDGD